MLRIASNNSTFVLAEIQFDVSLSSSHFFLHFLINVHLTGSRYINIHFIIILDALKSVVWDGIFSLEKSFTAINNRN
jgi:hypothetical protein